MSVVGYVRVSSVGQSLDVQLDKLKSCDKVFKEKMTGTFDKWPRLRACLEYVREGDTLVVSRLDRLARSMLHLCQVADQLQEKGVNLKVIDQSIDTGDATGRLLFNMLGAMAKAAPYGASRSLKQKFALSVRWMAFGMPKLVVSTWVGRRI